MRFVQIWTINNINQLFTFYYSFQNKQYIVGTASEGIDQNQFKDAEENVRKLRENVERLERKVADQYLVDFADLFQQNPTIDKTNPKAMLNLVKTWKQYQNVSISNPDQIENMIADLENQLDLVKKYVQEYDDVMRQKSASLMDLDELQKEGADIVKNLLILAEKDFGATAVLANEALAKALRETIACLKVQVRNESHLHLNLCYLRDN